MKIGNIYINGVIGKFPDEELGPNENCVELVDVIAQVQMQPDAEAFNVFVSSVGGYVSEGFEIHDYLVGLKKPIYTVGSGTVASMGTVIFMAGSLRILKPNTEFMVHLPSGGINGTSEEIQEYAKFMEDTEKRMITFYDSITNIGKDVLKPLLRDETWLDTTKAFELGFSNVATVERKAVAFFNNKPDNEMAKQALKKEDKTFLENAMAKIKKLLAKTGDAPTNVVLQDASGTELNFEEVEEGEEVVDGNVATVDGEPAEGEFIMEDGRTFSFAAGVVTITPAEDEDDLTEEEMAALIEVLTGERDTATAALTEANESLTTVTAERDAATAQLETVNTEFEAFQKELTSKFDFNPVSKKPKKKVEKPELGAGAAMKAKIAARKAGKNK